MPLIDILEAGLPQTSSLLKKKKKRKKKEKKSCVYAGRLGLVLSNSLWPCRLWSARLLCQGVLQARILEHIGQYWLPSPSKALYFLLPQPPTPLSTWCCQNSCDPTSCTASTPGPHWGKPKPSRADSGVNPSGDPHVEVEMEPQLKPRGRVAKEDPKPSHQLCRLQIKSTGPTRQTLCLWNI